MKRASNAPPEEYDHTKFITLQASRRYTALVKNKDFIKEKGFESSDDFFGRDIMGKGWQDLCKPPKLVIKAVVREFYANLREQVETKFWVRGKLVAFDGDTINRF